MFYSLFNLIFRVIEEIVSYIQFFVGYGAGWDNYSFNIYLFSDTGWFNTPIPLGELAVMIFGTFLFIFILRILWNGTKKFINMIFGVFRV
jgi:hypothetical protein